MKYGLLVEKIYYLDENKNSGKLTEIGDMVDKLLDENKKVLKKSEVLKDSFLSFIESLGVSVKKTANIMGYTFLIPLVPMFYNLATSGQFSDSELYEVIKRLSGFVGLNYGGIGLKELLSLMVSRFRGEK